MLFEPPRRPVRILTAGARMGLGFRKLSRMNKVPGRIVLFSLFLLSVPATGPAPAVTPPGSTMTMTMTTAAQAFLDKLRPDLRAQALLAFDDADRANWRYVPGRRRGVNLKAMNASERAAAFSLLKAGSSARGYEKAAGVIELEGILRELESFGWFRDPELYWITIFGAPSDGAPWGWRFEGHHVSLNFASIRGEIVLSTPAFLGANPARVPSGPRAGWRLLPAEEDIARRLLASLTPRQRARAMLSEKAPADIVMGPGRRMPPAPAGLPAAELSASQRETLLSLVAEYVRNARAEIADPRWKKIEAAGIEKIRFGWAGSAAVGSGHYYRVQGPTFLIEYDNTQDRANHVHSVWRDLPADSDVDLLRRHYEQSPHHAAAGGSASPSE
jgi:hypothetical protein